MHARVPAWSSRKHKAGGARVGCTARSADGWRTLHDEQDGPGKYNEEAWEALDRVLEEARRAGLKVILSFLDNWKYLGAGPAVPSQHPLLPWIACHGLRLLASGSSVPRASASFVYCGRAVSCFIAGFREARAAIA